MRMKRIAAAWALAFVMIPSCGANKDEAEIGGTLKSFFAEYKGDFRKVDGKYLSADLRSKIAAYAARENQEIEKVARSDYPADKLDMFDIDIFNASGETFSSYEILRVEVKGGRAAAKVRYVIHGEGKNRDVVWTDTVVLTREGSWRIDDVIYGDLDGSPHMPDMKLLFDSYIKKP